MSPAHVLEPTYAAIKQRLLDGAWPPGARLEGARIADLVGVSMTPVRDSLNRLAGERLVELRPGFGFHVPYLSALDLRELLALNLALVRLALVGTVAAGQLFERSASHDHAARSRSVFAEIACRARNQVLGDAIESLNDRLHPFRKLEEQVLPDAGQELAGLEAIVTAGPERSGVGGFRRYHQRRIAEAPRLVAVLQQTHANHS